MIEGTHACEVGAQRACEMLRRHCLRLGRRMKLRHCMQPAIGGLCASTPLAGSIVWRTTGAPVTSHTRPVVLTYVA